MGKQNNIELRGTVNGLIYYNWRGIACVRTKPTKVKQSPGTKANSAIFGMVANRSAVLRALVKPLLPEPGNREITKRVDQAFRQWLKTASLNEPAPVDNIPFFTGLSFNEKNELKNILLIDVTVSRCSNGQLILQVPAFNPVEAIKAPAKTTQVVIVVIEVIAASLQMEKPVLQDSVQTSITVDYVPGELAAQDIPLPLLTKPGCLSVITVAMLYFNGDNRKGLVEKLPWKPAGIVGSFYN